MDKNGSDFSDDSGRKFLATHPWITFKMDLREAPPDLWLLLGEARSKCERLGKVPLPPFIAQRLHRLALAKGVWGTTGIEGNTLTEEQVEQIVEKKLQLPPSQKYQQKEVENIIAACEEIMTALRENADSPLSTARIRGFNATVLDGLELEDGVIPGQIRTYSVGVSPSYRGAPHEDCEYLLDRLCEWLNGNQNESLGLGTDILKAIFAHLYVAWIHPFGDGNGRTARLVEVYLLSGAGVPTAAAHLLSNHYNTTRDRYRRELDRASKSGGNIVAFVVYALEGLVQQLSEHLELVQKYEVMLSWRDFINEFFSEKTSEADKRRKKLVMGLSTRIEPVKKSDVRTLSSEIETRYRGKTDKALTRDLNWLEGQGLVSKVGQGYRARTEIMLAYLPFSKRRPQS